MNRSVFCLPVLLLVFCAGAAAFTADGLRLVYATQGAAGREAVEYLVQAVPGGGYLVGSFDHGVKRVVECGPDLAATREEYHDAATGDHLTASRRGDALRLTGILHGRAVDRSLDLEAVPWRGSPLLLRDFALSGQAETLFLVLRPQDERVALLKAVREQSGTVRAGGRAVDAVRVRCIPQDGGDSGAETLHWFRLSDGLLVRTEELRGGTGTPGIVTELVSETPVEQPALAAWL